MLYKKIPASVEKSLNALLTGDDGDNDMFHLHSHFQFINCSPKISFDPLNDPTMITGPIYR